MTDFSDPKALADRQAKEDAHDAELTEYLRRIGAKSLAAELSDLRFRNRVVEARRWLDQHDALLSYQEQLHDRIDHRLMSNQAMLYDKAQSYANFVMTLGYAGFFGIWSAVRGQVHPWDSKLIAVLLGSSLVVFVVWTLVAMVFSGAAIRRVGAVLAIDHGGREHLLEAIVDVESKNLKLGLRLQKFWLPTFVFSALSGFGSAAILLALLLADVFAWSFSVHDLVFGPEIFIDHQMFLSRPMWSGRVLSF